MDDSMTPHKERVDPGDLEWRVYLAPHVQRYRFASRFVQGKKVLDAGCGVGYGCKLLAEAGAAAVVGADLSQAAIATAQQRFRDARVEFVCDDCESLLQVNGSFDVVVSLENIEHLQQPARFMQRLSQLIRPEGVFICSTPNIPEALNPGYRSENLYHTHEFTVEHFRSFLGEYFSDVQLWGQDFTAAHRATALLWSNPFVRLGRWLQGLRGRKVPDQIIGAGLPLTEGDLIISEVNAESAWTLVAICRQPRSRAPQRAGGGQL